MADTSFTQSRIQTLAIVVSAVTGQTFRFYGMNQFQVKKDDSGDAGTFTFSYFPLPPTVAISDVSDNAADYLKVASPMDVVAIYSRRLTINANNQIERIPFPIGPDASASLKYGGDGGATIRALGKAVKAPTQQYDGEGNCTGYSTPQASNPIMRPISNNSCIFVGMVDRAFEVIDAEGQMVGFSCSGRDLSKVFYVNDAFVPKAEVGSLAVPFLTSIALSKESSGTSLLLDVADILVGKQLNTNSIITNSKLSASTAATYQRAFGFPWRDFILTDRLQAGFRSFHSTGNGQQKYAPFMVQSGSAWANMQELRNYPVNRLFVDEFGQLVFDDQLAAWKQAPYTRVQADDIVAFQPGFDDSSLITFLSTWANGSLGARYNVSGTLGILRNNAFVGGLADAQYPKGANDVSQGTNDVISKFGYRYGEFLSNFDIDSTGAATRRAAVIWQHNNLWKAKLVLRGGPYYRVGDRLLVDIETSRAETTSQVWYINGVQHEFSANQEWTTTLDLAYPAVSVPTSQTVTVRRQS